MLQRIQPRSENGGLQSYVYTPAEPEPTDLPLLVGMHPKPFNIKAVAEHPGTFLIFVDHRKYLKQETTQTLDEAGVLERAYVIDTRTRNPRPCGLWRPWHKAEEIVRAFDAPELHLFGGLWWPNGFTMACLGYLEHRLKKVHDSVTLLHGDARYH